MNTNQHIEFLSFYMQLTPWVQAVVAFVVGASMLAASWFFKEIVVALNHPEQKYRKNNRKNSLRAYR